MSIFDDQQKAVDFTLAELRGEGVDISREIVEMAVKKVDAMPLHESVPPPPGHGVVPTPKDLNGRTFKKEKEKAPLRQLAELLDAIDAAEDKLGKLQKGLRKKSKV